MDHAVHWQFVFLGRFLSGLSASTASGSWTGSRKWFWILALTLLSVVKTGYCVFYDNHATQLPLVYQLQDPSLFPGDPFLGAMEGYMGWVWWLVAQLSEWVNIELVLGVLFLLTRFLLIYAAARLGSLLVPESKAAPVLAGLLLALGPYPILGDGTLVEVYWEQSSMFMPLFVLGLTLLLEGRAVAFFFLFAVAYLINPLYGSWAAVFFAATYLGDPARASWKRFALASPLFVVFVAPIFLGGVGVLSQPAVDMEQWMWVNRLLISPHAFPRTWPLVVFWRFLVFSLVVVMAGRSAPRRAGRLGRLSLVWTGLAWTFLALGFLAATGISRALLIFQPARATEFFYLAGGIAVAAVAARVAQERPGPRGLAMLVALYSTLLYLLVREFREYAAVASVVVGVILVSGLMVAEKRAGYGRRYWISSAALWLLFASGLTTAAGFGRRIKHEGLARSLYRLPEVDMAELAAWAESNTSVDAVFFHDPAKWEWSQFRYLARRPVFTTWKDASAVLWDPGFADEWEARFAAFGFRDDLREQWDLTKPGESWRVRRRLMKHYREMTDEDFRAMAEGYRIDYWIAPVSVASDFPEVARAGEFKVLDVR